MPYIEVLQKYAVFSGRAKRSEYWLFVLFHVIITTVLLALAGVAEQLLFLYILYILATVIPSLAVGARRLHDTRRSGWWQLIGLVPLVGWIVLLIFFVTGSDGDNQYGPRPA
jgi:uncharacterized membrane protein YhaH (DUF805 family)